MYGIFGVLNYIIIQKYGTHYSILVGGLLGLILSIIGRFYLHLPIKIFGFSPNTEYMVHFYAILIYAFIFYFSITPILLLVKN